MASGVRVGDVAPDFDLDGTDGRFRLSAHRGERVVLLFYPGDETPVCTKQFCSYAAREDELTQLDATVVGISAQDVASHRDFQRAHGIPVPLLADIDREGGARLWGGAPRVFGTQRAVFIVDERGVVRYRHVHALGMDYQRVDELREALERVGTAARALTR